MHRRTYLRRAGAVGAALSPIAIARPASAAGYPERPDHITNVGDDLEELEQYQPSMIMSQQARRKLIGVYGWYADSSEHDTRAYYYWAKYTSQQSAFEKYLPFVGSGPDAHFEDHEPFICFVDTETGEIDSVVMTGYHHFALEIDGSEGAFREGRIEGEETHLKIRIVDPWRHYRHGEGATLNGVLPDTISGAEFDSWLAKREAWYDLGIFDSSHTPAIEDPFEMLERDHWWEDGSRDAWIARNIWARFGFRGADETDALRYEE